MQCAHLYTLTVYEQAYFLMVLPALCFLIFFNVRVCYKGTHTGIQCRLIYGSAKQETMNITQVSSHNCVSFNRYTCADVEDSPGHTVEWEKQVCTLSPGSLGQ